MKGLILYLFLIFAVHSFAQVDSTQAPIVIVDIPDVPESILPKEPIKDSIIIYEVVEVSPEFPGGRQELYQFLSDNIIYPDSAKTSNIQGKVYIQFIIHEDGCIDGFKKIKSPHRILTNAAIDVLQLMPDWIPGEHMGKCVKVRCTIPINFVMDDSDFKNKKKRKHKK